MNPGQLRKAKRDIRRRILAIRDAMPASERARRGAAVIERFLSLPEVAAARTVMVFWSFGSEIPTAPLIEGLHGRGIVVGLPRIEGDELVCVRFEPGQRTRSTTFGAEEPDAGAVVPTAAIDVVAVPGVAFDRGGARIGYGRGFYDRFLPRIAAFTAGLAFGLQVLDEPLPRGRSDHEVDAVLTETETIRPTGGGRT